MSREMTRRLAVAGVGIPLCVAVTWAGDLLFVGGIAVLAAVSAREYVHLYRRGDGPRPLYAVTVAGAAAFPFLVHGLGVEGAWVLAAAVPLLAGAWALGAREIGEGPVASAALTVFGVLYLGGLLGFSVPIRASVEGRAAGTLLFFLPVTVTWLVDTAAFLGGRTFGRRKMAPRISPNKTWAGAASALAAGPTAALLYVLLLMPLAEGGYAGIPGGGLGPGAAALLGLLLGGAAILGDLVESALKRECGAKDSSGLLPGHGGLLDRLDSLLWAIPAAHLFFALHRALS